MKKIRILSIICFVAAVVLFGLYQFKELRLRDHVAPRIDMDSESITISVDDGEEAILQGVTATDSDDGDVSKNLMVESYSNFIEPGRRNVTIAAVDNSNNVAKASREVIYSDYRSPKFSLTGAMRFPTGTTNILENLSADDVLDGNISDRIKISPEYTILSSTPGDYHTVLSVTNSGGDVTNLPLTVTIYDPVSETQKPKFTLSQYIVYANPGSNVNPWDYVNEIWLSGTNYVRMGDGVLYDEEGNAITAGRVSMDTSKVNMSIPGEYEITYSIADDGGNIGLVRLIVIVRE